MLYNAQAAGRRGCRTRTHTQTCCTCDVADTPPRRALATSPLRRKTRALIATPLENLPPTEFMAPTALAGLAHTQKPAHLVEGATAISEVNPRGG